MKITIEDGEELRHMQEIGDDEEEDEVPVQEVGTYSWF